MAEDKIEEQQVSEDGRYPDVVTRFRPDKLATVEQLEQAVVFTTKNGIELEITVVTPDILRLSYSTEGDIDDDFSYAIDPQFKPTPTDFSVEKESKYVEISTSALTCRVLKKGLLAQFYNANDELICQDHHGYYKRESLMKGISEVSISQKAPKKTGFYGLGDKAVEQNLRGRSYENWNTDAYGYERGDDPLYRSVPFFMALNGDRAYGIFLDNTYRTTFDFDRRKDNTMSFSAEGGQMNYYFINGPKLMDVARRYAKLTGTPELPPMWGLGYHQCRWSYYPDSKVKKIAKKFRDLKIPCDAIYIDIDYMDGYKVFTWNKEYFPNPKKMITDLKKDGFHTIVMIDPGVSAAEDYDVYEDGLAKDVFCKRPDGDMMIGPVWPPKTVFPDFTNPSVRQWWGTLYEELLTEQNVGGIWNDMNEPAVFEVRRKTFPDDIRHHFDGRPCSHRKAHNVYGMQMARASYEGIKSQNPDKRPFLLTRANFAGGQRYAALWTGDNIASWDHLRLANEQCIRLSISGYSFCGTDIGGFVDPPSPKLYTRWMQLGIFHPLFRTHSMGYNVDGAAAVKEEEVEQRKAEESELNQEPWAFGKRTTNIARKTIELRYRLLAYLYTAFYQYVTNGTPILRPLVFHDQSDKNVLDTQEFMFGDQILVSPVLEKGQKSKDVYLPEGDWYHFWDDERLQGQEEHEVKAPLKQIPFFIKAGTVLPMRELMQHTGEKQPDTLELLVYHGEEREESLLYEDAEQGYDYQDGKYRKTNFHFESKDNKINVKAEREGSYKPGYDEVEVIFIGLPFEPMKCEVDGEDVTIETVKRNRKQAFKVTVDPGFELITFQ
ncbi:glycoside hydrolase family 31 protein [Aliifodinibius sp. S!AR15-10]|uniref:glycoside hydrolase family 31 protein n=1 Tax=Aliifodinibius sp. S!AR15-10 TaxID=2950437 RepID=UPI002866F3C0|nr:glycoside hydrolase family 31 protein [Aliifodinibius sp. S!AR15-10]MDR8392005.1 glycoside hydrolase family 31 protein [Aliifodinibius sp. S!AR15-10]